MTICIDNLLGDSWPPGVGCDAIPNLENAIENIVDYVCTIMCLTDEIKIAPCGTAVEDFIELWPDCLELPDGALVIVNCPAPGQEIWYWDETDWVQLLLERINFSYGGAVNHTDVKAGTQPMSTLRTHDIVVQDGDSLEVMANMGYRITTYGFDPSGPKEHADFRITFTNQSGTPLSASVQRDYTTWIDGFEMNHTEYLDIVGNGTVRVTISSSHTEDVGTGYIFQRFSRFIRHRIIRT